MLDNDTSHGYRPGRCLIPGSRHAPFPQCSATFRRKSMALAMLAEGESSNTKFGDFPLRAKIADMASNGIIRI